MNRLDLALTLYRDLLQQADLLNRPPEQVDATQRLAASYAFQGAIAFLSEKNDVSESESRAALARLAPRGIDPGFLREAL